MLEKNFIITKIYYKSIQINVDLIIIFNFFLCIKIFLIIYFNFIYNLYTVRKYNLKMKEINLFHNTVLVKINTLICMI